ncbi:hypothetical protein GF337_15165 [candidate division KSB1 bacterium]|nr:hypothetical protein [candidate division KSB1 bacterium]
MIFYKKIRLMIQLHSRAFLVPTIFVGIPGMTLCVMSEWLYDAKRRRVHSHAGARERGDVPECSRFIDCTAT